MKDLYLLIFRGHKKAIILFFSVSTLVGIYIQYQENIFDFASFLSIGLSYFYCLYTWFNGTFTFAAPVNENSNDSDIIWRWLMIAISFLLFLYAIFEPLF